VTTLHQGQRAAVALLVMLGAACSDSPTIPAPGSIRASVMTLGGDIDVDGYLFVVDTGAAATRQPIFPSGTATRSEASAGTHTVALEQVAENCTVAAPNPRVVTVMPGQTTNVNFEVNCVATGIAITTRTAGVDGPNAYDVVLNGRNAAAIGSNDSVVVGRLQPGTHTIALSVASNCTVAGTSPVTVEVLPRTTTRVLFQVTCVSPPRPERIAFVLDLPAGNLTEWWIGVVNPDGMDGTNLVAGHSPMWSPNGTRLVFSTTYCDEYYFFYYDDPCTGGLHLIDPETRNITTLPAASDGLSPAWAPTGDRIAFRRCCELGFESTRLHVLTLSGGAAVDVAVPGVRGIRDLAWSLDGQRIAFACMVVPPQWDLCLVDTDGGNLVRMTNDAVSDFAPAWSPDGSRIAFSRSDGANQQIAIMTVGDGAVRVLTTGRKPAWSRDGKTLVFADFGGLYTIAVGGSDRARLTNGAHDAPVWRP